MNLNMGTKKRLACAILLARLLACMGGLLRENHGYADSVLAPVASGLRRGVARSPWQKQSKNGGAPCYYLPLAVPVMHGILQVLWRSRALLFEMGLQGIVRGGVQSGGFDYESFPGPRSVL